MQAVYNSWTGLVDRTGGLEWWIKENLYLRMRAIHGGAVRRILAI